MKNVAHLLFFRESISSGLVVRLHHDKLFEVWHVEQALDNTWKRIIVEGILWSHYNVFLVEFIPLLLLSFVHFWKYFWVNVLLYFILSHIIKIHQFGKNHVFSFKTRLWFTIFIIHFSLVKYDISELFVLFHHCLDPWWIQLTICFVMTVIEKVIKFPYPWYFEHVINFLFNFLNLLFILIFLQRFFSFAFFLNDCVK